MRTSAVVGGVHGYITQRLPFRDSENCYKDVYICACTYTETLYTVHRIMVSSLLSPNLTPSMTALH